MNIYVKPPARPSKTVGTPATSWDALVLDWLAGLFMARLSVDIVESHSDGFGAMLLETLGHEPGCSFGASQMRAALRGGASAETLSQRLGESFEAMFGVSRQRMTTLFPGRSIDLSTHLCRAIGTETEDAPIPSADIDRASRLWIDLSLLARLIRSGASDHDQPEMIDTRLLAWLPGLVVQATQTDRTGFYAGAAGVLIGYLSTRRNAILDEAATHAPCRAHNRMNRGMH